MKVTDWTDWDNEKYEELPNKMSKEAFDAVVDEVREKGYKFSGYTHQQNRLGCPILDNKYRYNVSCRMWGDIMAHAYGLYKDEEDDMAYVYWAWTPNCIGKNENGEYIFEDEILPEGHKL